MNYTQLLTSLLLIPALMVSSARADDFPSFKSRKDQEKKFITQVCMEILKAAHFSGKEREMEKYSIEDVKKGRKKLTIKGTYKGLISNKVYNANITIHIDASDADKWEVMRIEYSDNNNIPYSRKKVEELIKKFNRSE